MSRSTITRLMDEMSLEELSDLKNQIDAQIENGSCNKNEINNITAQPSEPRVVKYRYKAQWGTVIPSHMKKTVLQDHNTCMLGISLGSANSEGDRFEGSIRWIAQNFSRCILVVADSIYRYTLQVIHKAPMESATTDALKLGEAFIAAHAAIIDRYRDECDFEWRCMSQVEQHSDFESYHEAYKTLYEQDAQIQSAINDEADKYLAGLASADVVLDSQEKDRASAISAKYFLEETAIFTCLCQQDTSVLIYPGTIKPLQIFSQAGIEGVPDPILKLIMIRLNLSSKTPYFCSAGSMPAVASLVPAYACSVLDDLTDEHWGHIRQYCEHKKFQVGDILVPKGKPNRALTILLKGNAEVLEGDWDSGQVNRTMEYGPVSLFGERSFFEGEPATKTLAALTDGELLELNSYSLKKMKKKVPATVTYLLSDIARLLAVRVLHEKSGPPSGI